MNEAVLVVAQRHNAAKGYVSVIDLMRDLGCTQAEAEGYIAALCDEYGWHEEDVITKPEILENLSRKNQLLSS